MKIFNTLTKKKETLDLLRDFEVSMYVCGPTVYDVGHLGHGRAAVVFDVSRKYFEYKGLKVKFITNYTDIDDKTINRAAELSISVPELVARIVPEYERDFKELGIAPPTKQTYATKYIKEMIELIKRLEKAGVTYSLDDGVYFDVSKFPAYGKLSGQKLEDLQMGARVEVNKNKRNPYDFVLWKFEKPGEPSWESAFGKGRPGWHIECSAMCFKELGETFDIHGGGQDLIFPHHECEIAQSETANGKPFARYWMHNGFVNINKEKMSKSLKNFVTLKEVFKKYSGKVLRLMYLQKHYRAPIDFSWDLIEQARSALARIHEFSIKLAQYKAFGGKADFEKYIQKFLKKFEAAMDDDFETPEALASLYDFISDINKIIDKGFDENAKKKILETLRAVDNVLGIIFSDEKIPKEIIDLANERLIERENKNFEAADNLRSAIIKKGYEIEDTEDGFLIRKV
ncbi:cysteine--tRNA ligase [Candidatus Peregrinibacteria bacterium]|nr:cysteine--tRNA ligase [Candidatus Peregrinibacteria bacterium]